MPRCKKTDTSEELSITGAHAEALCFGGEREKKQPVDVLLQAAAHRPVCFSSDVLTLAELGSAAGGFVAVLEHYQPLNPQKNQNSLSDSGLQSGRRPKSVWRTVVRRGDTPPFPSPKAHFSLSRRSLYVD